MLSLDSPHDVQLAMRDFIKVTRKQKYNSVKELSERSGVPYATIRRFEDSAEISFRQFLMLYDAIDDLANIKKLTKATRPPTSLDQVLDNAR